MEKGSRALYLGVNPHSKGLIFSRLMYSFLLKLKPNLKIKVIKIKIMSIEEPKKYIS